MEAEEMVQWVRTFVAQAGRPEFKSPCKKLAVKARMRENVIECDRSRTPNHMSLLSNPLPHLAHPHIQSLHI